MRLVSPSSTYRAPFLDMAEECARTGDYRYSPALEDFDGYLHAIAVRGRRETAPDGWVPSTELWLEDDGRIIGCVRLRFALTPELEREGGHIGYDVRPSMRRRGYGTQLLRLALLEARAAGISRVCVTCDDDNAGSIAVIERNGGKLAAVSASSTSAKPVRQYWIDLPPQ